MFARIIRPVLTVRPSLVGIFLASVTTLAVAQQREYRDPRSFPFNEAVQEPAAVIVTQQSTNWYGDHPLGTNDPLFRAQELLGRPTDTSVTINVEAVEEVEAYFEYGTVLSESRAQRLLHW